KTVVEDGRNEIARNAQTMQQIVPDHVPFPCNVTGSRSQEVPNSIHKLRPGDIDVIAAMGDSLTAGAGIFANNLFQILVENRGVTALGGGQGTWRQYVTLPNIFKVEPFIDFSRNRIFSHVIASSHTRSVQKVLLILNFRGLRIFDFRFFYG
ncbi:PREDICTED: phospholipase B1, membrane-associated-like, partial [Dinoponera quadriceps]|uniref:Phospholipase B1, membrane-associated-like n=1 Tax=Dinoponera quadriceps TaxID=609295 RepID=A0A6P3YBQ3_DINQU